MTVIEQKTFADFKINFYTKIKDFSIFDCAEFNILKVVLDGLHVNYYSKGKIRTPIFYFYPLYLLFLFIKRNRNKKKNNVQYKNHTVLILDSARSVKTLEGKYLHFRYENILRYYGKEKCTFILDRPDTRLAYDYDFLSLRQEYAIEALSDSDRILRKELIKTFAKITRSQLFNFEELQNIKIAIQLFFEQYRTFDAVVKKGKYKVSHFAGHYHREGFMLALKRNNVLAYELQHGLIAPEDIFYVFPSQVKSIVKKALFPDKIFVYSNYWKNVLLLGTEFEEKQIEIIGDYHYKTVFDEISKKALLEFKQQDELILIATQTTLHTYFIEYTKFLHDYIVKNNLNYKILLKIHPHEKEELYAEILNLNKLMKVDAPITNLFRYCRIQISIYSTTLYESFPFNILNYSLDVPSCKDYVKHFIENGISQLLSLNETPFEKLNITNAIPSDFYYAKFTPDVLNI